jgi:hypothetical protein
MVGSQFKIEGASHISHIFKPAKQSTENQNEERCNDYSFARGYDYSGGNLPLDQSH